jgi:D-aminopeptidase
MRLYDRATLPDTAAMVISSDALDRAVAELPRRYPGPGGACAVLRHGEVLVRHAWGWANAERRIAFSPATLFRMCSITKQFTCGVVLDQFGDASDLDQDVREQLPLLTQAPGAQHLCHNQSGLRDYWAVAMLHGSPAEAAFSDRDAAHIIGRTQSLQFAPGTAYSYCNQNFRILSDILQSRTGRSFAELLRTRIFEPAGMHTAFLAADTSGMPDGTVGYEGTQETGFRPALNRILWTGDAGLGASLDDMIAWERFIDATAEDAKSLYRRISVPVTFKDGAAAEYGFGLGRRRELGRHVTGHGGALRGWRSHRINLPAERISVVVMFNHLADAREAAIDLLAACLGEVPSATRPAAQPASQDMLGAYIDPESGLSARIDDTGGGQVRVRYGHSAEKLDVQDAGVAGKDGTVLRHSDGGLWMDRPAENQRFFLHRLSDSAPADVTGRYHCAELDAALTVTDAGGALYGGFSGFLGQGPMEVLDHVGGDVWALPCPRALDHTPPGDWTLRFNLEGGGRPTHVTVGCWLARNLHYARVP